VLFLPESASQAEKFACLRSETFRKLAALGNFLAAKVSCRRHLKQRHGKGALGHMLLFALEDEAF
jgi:hypothetical protein